MRSLKDRGMRRELAPLIRRVKRAYAMGRISTQDFNYLLKRLQEVEARIVSMTEINEAGEEVLEPDGQETAAADRDLG